jgi:hypothetical protein
MRQSPRIDYDPVTMLWEYLDRFPQYHFVMDHWWLFVAPLSFAAGFTLGKLLIEVYKKYGERMTTSASG